VEDDLRSEVHGLLLTQLRRAKRAVEDAVTVVLRGDPDLARRVISGEDDLLEDAHRLEEIALRALTKTKNSDIDVRWWITAGKLARSLRRLSQYGVWAAQRFLAEEGKEQRLPDVMDVAFPQYVRTLLSAAEEIIEAFLVREEAPLRRVRAGAAFPPERFGFSVDEWPPMWAYTVFLFCAGNVLMEMFGDVHAYLEEGGCIRDEETLAFPSRTDLVQEIGRTSTEKERGVVDENEELKSDED